MIRRVHGFLAPALLGACALVLAAPRDASASKGVTGTVTVQPTGDPVGLFDGTLYFTPDTSIKEYFAPNPAYPAAPTDYFTLSGFGTFIGLNSISLTDFSLVNGTQGTTTLDFVYTGTGDLTTPITIGTFAFTATDYSPTTLTIAYFDHQGFGTSNPQPNSGTNLITATPEPSTLALLGLGAVGGLYFRKRLAGGRA